jgi:uncharacterized protein (DUF1778 family)
MAGGYRENSGRKDAFGGKDDAPVGMVFTPNGEKLLAAACERTGLSRNDVLTHLVLKHAARLRFAAEGIVFRGKRYTVPKSIRVTTRARKLLDSARERTGKSYSDLGEALLVQFAEGTRDYPAPYEPGQRKQKRRGPVIIAPGVAAG